MQGQVPPPTVLRRVFVLPAALPPISSIWEVGSVLTVGGLAFGGFSAIAEDILEFLWEGYPISFIRCAWSFLPNDHSARQYSMAIITALGGVFTVEWRQCRSHRIHQHRLWQAVGIYAATRPPQSFSETLMRWATFDLAETWSWWQFFAETWRDRPAPTDPKPFEISVAILQCAEREGLDVTSGSDIVLRLSRAILDAMI